MIVGASVSIAGPDPRAMVTTTAAPLPGRWAVLRPPASRGRDSAAAASPSSRQLPTIAVVNSGRPPRPANRYAHDNRNVERRKVLLVRQIAIRGDEYFELAHR